MINNLYHHKNSNEFLILVIINTLFILSILIPIYGNAINYFVNIIAIGIIFNYLILIKNYKLKNHTEIFLIFLLIAIWLMLPIVDKHNAYITLFVTKLILLIFFFNSSNITVNNFTKIINITYLVYLILSILAWFKLIPFLDYTTINSFMINIEGFNFETLYGVSGSTADIDTYSGIVFLWNLLIYQGKYKKIMMIISLIAVVLTFRGTPIVALSASLVIYVLVRQKILAFLSLLLIIFGLVLVIYIEYFYPYEQVFFLSQAINWKTVFWEISHARSALWHNQIQIYLNDLSWYQYIYGPDLQSMMTFFTRPDGLDLKESYNPHNSYLLLIYRSTVFFVIFYLCFLYYSVKTFSRRFFPIIFFIALAALTNSSLFGLENPVYVLMILYIITHVTHPHSKLS